MGEGISKIDAQVLPLGFDKPNHPNVNIGLFAQCLLGKLCGLAVFPQDFSESG